MRDCAVTGSKTQISRYIYAGQGGALSVAPLRILLDRGIRPAAVLVPHKPAYTTRVRTLNLLPVQPPRLLSNLANLAIEAGLPLITWEKGAEGDLKHKLAEFDAELVIVSCFPWRVPAELLNVPLHGWWNLHPSLLPAYRGPSPLFWQARDGIAHTGITLHRMEEAFDEGPIIAQAETVMNGDMTIRQLEQLMGQMGGDMLERALTGLASNSLQFCRQDTRNASYEGKPTMDDRHLRTSGKASAAHVFVSLVYDSYPLWMELDGRRFAITKPVSADDTARLETAWCYADNQLQVCFEKGVLTVQAEELNGHS